jgi:hypothetical protein
MRVTRAAAIEHGERARHKIGREIGRPGTGPTEESPVLARGSGGAGNPPLLPSLTAQNPVLQYSRRRDVRR